MYQIHVCLDINNKVKEQFGNNRYCYENKIRIMGNFWEVLEGIISKILSILGSDLQFTADIERLGKESTNWSLLCIYSAMHGCKLQTPR